MCLLLLQHFVQLCTSVHSQLKKRSCRNSADFYNNLLYAKSRQCIYDFINFQAALWWAGVQTKDEDWWCKGGVVFQNNLKGLIFHRKQLPCILLPDFALYKIENNLKNMWKQNKACGYIWIWTWIWIYYQQHFTLMTVHYIMNSRTMQIIILTYVYIT